MRIGRWGRTGNVVACLAMGALSAAWPSQALARRRKAPAVVRACVDDYKAALNLEQGGQLIAARERFVRCSKTACGSTLRQECTTRFTQLDGEIPSLVPLATDGEGAPRFDVQVKMDGQLLTDKLNGRAWQLDPGRHELSFSADGEVFSTQELLVAQGQRNRAVQATLKSLDKRASKLKRAPEAVAAEKQEPAPPNVNLALKEPAATTHPKDGDEASGSGGADATVVTKEDTRGHVPRLAYVLSGTGVVGLAGFGMLTYWGRKDADLLASCSPSCPESSATHIKRLYLGANISLGVGVAALAGAYWAYAHARAAPQTEQSATETACVFGVQPAAAGAVGTISGTF